MTDSTTPNSPGLAPSSSTVASGLGGAVAVGVVWGLHLFGVNLPAGIEAGLAAILTALSGYLPATGRK